MAAKKTITYECEVCGTEVTVISECLSTLSPIYCCGVSLGGGVRGKKKPQKKGVAVGAAGRKNAPRSGAKKRAVPSASRVAKKDFSGKAKRRSPAP